MQAGVIFNVRDVIWLAVAILAIRFLFFRRRGLR